MADLSPPLEKPDIYNGLYLLGQTGNPFTPRKQPLAHSLLLVRWFLSGKCLEFCNF